MNPAEPALHEMNPTGRFSDRAADYVKYRPGYPAAAIGAVLEGLGPPASVIAADVGAGTGISARALADRGLRVIAVEPNPDMRRAATAHPRVEWCDGVGEATGLAGGSVDLVLCAQAFHWMRQPEAARELARILRACGRLALMWNERDRADPLMLGYKTAIQDVGGEHPAELREFDPGVVDATGLFTSQRLVEVPSAQRLDEPGLIGRAMSASYVPKEGDRAARLTARLCELFARYRETDGLVTLRYVTRIWLWERR